MGKNVITEIKTLLGMEVKLEQMKLDNGTVIEADVFEQGAEVFVVSDEDRIALPMGEYTLEDGRLLVVSEDGVIGEIKEVTEEEPTEAPEEEMEVAAEEVATPKKIIESVSKEQFFDKDEFLDFMKRFEALELSVQKLSKEEKAEEKVELEETKPLVHNPEKLAKQKHNFYKKESLVEFLNNKK